MADSKTILIVEDDPLIRESVEGIINEIYPLYDVKKACDGKEGEEVIESYKPNLIITDLNMPVKNGTYVIAKGQESGIPVILMSDFCMKESYENASKKLNPDYILPKPFGADELKTAIDTFFDPAKSLE